MKKYILTLSLIFTAVFAFAYTHSVSFEKVNKTFLQNFVLQGEATYCVQLADNAAYLENETVQDIALNAINDWFNKAGKTDLDDIVEMMKNGNIEQIPCQSKDESIKPDLSIIFDPDLTDSKCQNDSGCYDSKSGSILIYTSPEKTNAEYITQVSKQLGYAFGLIGQAKEDLYKGSFLYTSGVKRDSVMDEETEVTCDDIDGLITVIDRITNQSREFNSTCPGGLSIYNGRAVDKNTQKYNFKEHYSFCDAETSILYYRRDVNVYIANITLKNFSAEDSMGFFKDVGFEISDPEVLTQAEMKINGMFREDGRTRKPISSWKAVLYLKENGKMVEKQTLFKNFSPKNQEAESNPITENKPKKCTLKDWEGDKEQYNRTCSMPFAEFMDFRL